MNEIHAKQIDLLLSRSREIHASAKDTAPRLAVLCGTGHGDHMRGIAFCQALKRKYPGCHIIVMLHFSAAGMVAIDLAHYAKKVGVIDDYLLPQDVDRAILVHRLLEEFDGVFDCVPYAVGAFWRTGGAYDAEESAARRRLASFADLYSGHPVTAWRVKFKPYTVFEMMAASSGVPVDEGDLIVPYECAPPFEPKGLSDMLREYGGSEVWSKARVTGCRYVVVQNNAGGAAAVKEAPPEVFKAIGSRLMADGIRCVQVGGQNDPKLDIDRLIDRRGFRLPLTVRIIEQALMVVTIEGFIHHVAMALDKPCLTLFGPTPIRFFAYDPQVNAIAFERKEDGTPTGIKCPLRTCFQGGGFTQAENWHLRCPLGPHHPEHNPAGNPAFPYCMNFIEPGDAAHLVGRMCMAIEEQRQDASDRETEGAQAAQGA